MDFTCRCGQAVYETGVNRRALKDGKLHYDGIEKRYVCPEPTPARVIDQSVDWNRTPPGLLTSIDPPSVRGLT